jgi:hypothetical protein
VVALVEGAVGDAPEELGVVPEVPTLAQLISSGLQPKWSSLSAWRRASIWSISCFLEMKAARASSLDLAIWFRILGLIVGLRGVLLW